MSIASISVANAARIGLYGLAAGAIGNYSVPKFIAKYDAGANDLLDPAQPYRKAIIDAAQANRLDPAFLAAIIAAELSDLKISDWSFDAPGFAAGTSLGWAQISDNNVKRLHPDFGLWKRMGMAIRPESSIRLAAELIRLTADEGAMNRELSDFKCNEGWVHPPDFGKDGREWTDSMMCAAAYNYTQTEWLIENNHFGERDMVFHPRAGGYGIAVVANYREFYGKCD